MVCETLKKKKVRLPTVVAYHEICSRSHDVTASKLLLWGIGGLFAVGGSLVHYEHDFRNRYTTRAALHFGRRPPVVGA